MIRKFFAIILALSLILPSEALAIKAKRITMDDDDNNFATDNVEDAIADIMDGTVIVGKADNLEDSDGDTQIQVEESADDDTIRFDAFGSEKMVIDSTGVGVGDSSPTNALDVVGTISATGRVQLGSETAASAACISNDSDRLYHDTNCDGVKDGGEEYLDASGGGSGDSVTIDGVSVTDPDFTSGGNVVPTNNSNTVTYNVNWDDIEALIQSANINWSNVIAAELQALGINWSSITNAGDGKILELNGSIPNWTGLNIVLDTTPQLGGNLDGQGYNFTDIGDVTFKTGANGGTLRTGTSNADKFELQAYDVDGSAYVKVLEVDAGNDVTLEVFDESFTIRDTADETKRVEFELGGITASNTRTITPLDENMTLVGESNTQTLTNKTINTASNTITVVEADISDLSHTTDQVGTLTTGDLCVNDGSSVNCTVNTEAELETALDSTNVIVSTEIDTEAEVEAILTDVTDVFTNNDGTLADDDLSDNVLGDIGNVITTQTGLTAVVEPNGDGSTTNWTTNGTCTGGDYGCVNDGVTDPTVPTTSNYLSSSNTDNVEEMLAMDTVSGISEATQIAITSYVEVGSCGMGAADIEVEISNDNGSTWSAVQEMDLCSVLGGGSPGWITKTFTSLSWTQTQLNNFQVRFTVKNEGSTPSQTSIYATYATVTYSTAVSSGGILIWDGSENWDGLTMSGDVTMTSAGVTTVADDSHNHVISNIDSFSSSDLRGQLSDESGTGAAIFAGGDIGAATATTPSADDNDTSVATTAYVQTELGAMVINDLSDVVTSTTGNTQILDPNADGTTADWTTNGTCTGGDYDCIDDEVRDPTEPDITNYLTTATNNQTEEIAFETLAGVSEVTQVDVVSYASASNCASGTSDIEVEISNDNGATWSAVQEMDLCNGGTDNQWITNSFTSLTWTQSELDALEVRYTGKEEASMTTVTVYASYVNITYDTAPSSGDFLVYDGSANWDGVTLSGDISSVSSTGSVTINAALDKSWTGSHNFTGGDLRLPNAAAPTTDATGEISLDTTIADHQPLLQYYDGSKNMTIIAIDTSELPATDNQIIKYDAATDKFLFEADATGAGGGGGSENWDADIIADIENAFEILVGDAGTTKNANWSVVQSSLQNKAGFITGLNWGELNGATNAYFGIFDSSLNQMNWTDISNYALQNVVEDTTPQSGGNWDAQGYNFTDIGYLGIGTTSPTHVFEAIDGVGSGTTAQTNTKFVFDSDDHSVIGIHSPNDKFGRIGFADPEDDLIGAITYNHVDDDMAFYVNNSEAMTIASDGDVTIAGLTASRIVGTNASSQLVDLDTATYPSLTELSYVKGVTSSIQTQLDAKESSTSNDIDPDRLNGDTGDNNLVDAAIIDSAITRDTEWDTFAEINAASTDTDAVLDTDIGSTVQAYDADLDDLSDGFLGVEKINNWTGPTDFIPGTAINWDQTGMVARQFAIGGNDGELNWTDFASTNTTIDDLGDFVIGATNTSQNTYNVDDTGGDAWHETDSTSDTSALWTNLADVNANNYTSGNKTTVSTDDNNYVEATDGVGGSGACSMGPPDPERSGHRFKFNISESESAITKITPTVKVRQHWATSGSTLYLYMWDSTNTEWDEIDTQTSPADSTKYTLTAEVTANLTDYVDGSNDIYLMAFVGHTDCAWGFDAAYAEVVVDAGAGGTNGDVPVYKESSSGFESVTVTGDIAIDETGITTIQANAVDSDDYVDSSIDSAHINWTDMTDLESGGVISDGSVQFNDIDATDVVTQSEGVLSNIDDTSFVTTQALNEYVESGIWKDITVIEPDQLRTVANITPFFSITSRSAPNGINFTDGQLLTSSAVAQNWTLLSCATNDPNCSSGDTVHFIEMTSGTNLNWTSFDQNLIGTNRWLGLRNDTDGTGPDVNWTKLSVEFERR